MENNEKNEEMEKYLQDNENLGTPNIGEIRECKIIQVGEDHIIVDVSAKIEGIINSGYLVKEMSEYKIDDVIKAVVTSYRNDDESRLYLSEKKYMIRKVLKDLKEGGEGKTVKGHIVKKVRGGYTVEIGGVLSAFLPGSQASSLNSIDPSELTKEEYEFKIITFEQRGRGRNYNIVLSRDFLINEERAKFLDTIEKDQKIKGEVDEITNFGVFVDVGPMTALLPRSEVTWDKNVNLKERFHVGEEIEALVISKDVKNGKMSLSTKRLTPDPWEDIEKKYPVDSVVDAVVTGIAPFGIFVKIEEGVKGLVHSSEIFYGNYRRNLKNYFEEGQNVKVEVINVNAASRKISFSIKKVLGDPWDGIEERYHTGDTVETSVVKILDNGAILEIEEGVSGFAHISELSWNFVKKPSNVLKKGEKVSTKIIEIDPESRRMRLSIKRTLEDPWIKLSKEVKPGTPVDCEIISVKNSGAIVRIVEYNVEGFLPRSHFIDGVEEGKIMKGKIHKVSYNPQLDERDMVVTLRNGERSQRNASGEKKEESFLNPSPMTTTIGDMVNEKSEKQK